jgi:hypothetical protein
MRDGLGSLTGEVELEVSHAEQTIGAALHTAVERGDPERVGTVAVGKLQQCGACQAGYLVWAALALQALV